MKKLTSLKWQIGKYLVIFSVLTTIVIFVFQIVLLKPMYESSKINSIKTVGEYVTKSLKNDQLSDFVTFIASQSDTCVLVSKYDLASEKQTVIGNSGCMVTSVTTNEKAEFIAKAMQSKDKTYIARIRSDSSDFDFDLNNSQTDNFDTIVFTKVVNTSTTNSVIMVSGNITPVNATTQTLASQMRYVGLFMVLSVTFLTIIMYKRIAKPIILITDEAKALPKGQYHINPKTNCYKEASALNDTLAEAAVDIHKADQAKRDLISNVSHDLRTPLTMISGYGEMMIDLPEEKTDENIQVIVNESKRLNALVNDLLDMSRLQDGKIVLEKQVFDISTLLKAQLHKYDVYVLQEGYKIESQLLDPVYVNADVKRMEQVINNFMNNAINYGGEAKHIIVREILKDDNVRIEIQDFGEGIEESDIPKIWDRYYKVDKEHVRVSNGSGIGLNIVKQILDLHRFTYGVISKKGSGSTFYFEMPIEKNNRLSE